MKTRSYRQSARAASASEKTERIMRAACDLFVELPFDKVTLAAVAKRAGVGLQTLIRRVETKDGLVAAVGAWIAPQVQRDLGDPAVIDADAGGDARRVADDVAAAFGRHYGRWAAMIERTISQAESSPALDESARGGRAAHRSWIDAAFARLLTELSDDDREVVRARLVAVTGVEFWLVLTRHEGMSPDRAQQTLALLITSSLTPPIATLQPEPTRKQQP